MVYGSHAFFYAFVFMAITSEFFGSKHMYKDGSCKYLHIIWHMTCKISDLKHSENVKLSGYIQQTEHNIKSASNKS